jgi:hypothetical protein
MNIFSIIPLWGRLLMLAALATALLAFGWTKGAEHEQNLQAKRDLKSTTINTGITARWAKGKDDALAKANETAQINDAAADILATHVASLRSDLAAERAKLPSASDSSARQYAATANAVFQQCTERYRDVAGDAAKNAADALMLEQAWPK